MTRFREAMIATLRIVAALIFIASSLLIVSAWIDERGDRVTHIGLLGMGIAVILAVTGITIVFQTWRGK